MSETVKCRQGILGMGLCELSCWLDVDGQFIRAGRIDMTKNLSMMERERFFDQVPVFRRHFTSHPLGWSGYAVHSAFSIHFTSLLARFSILLCCFRHSM
ncbi:hypothetical protein P692DRAFT_20840597, partial [Suillus brevipes Sb2]